MGMRLESGFEATDGQEFELVQIRKEGIVIFDDWQDERHHLMKKMVLVEGCRCVFRRSE
jgi:hypothetical protein